MTLAWHVCWGRSWGRSSRVSWGRADADARGRSQGTDVSCHRWVRGGLLGDLEQVNADPEGLQAPRATRAAAGDRGS